MSERGLSRRIALIDDSATWASDKVAGHFNLINRTRRLEELPLCGELKVFSTI